MSSTLASDFCSGDLSFNSHFKDLTKTIKKSGDSLANSKAIASQADKVLSKLLSNKSPLVMKWIKAKKLDPLKQEVQIVKEWRKYFLENFIFAKFSGNSAEVKKLVNDSFVNIYKTGFTKEIVSKFDKLFSKAVNNSVKYIGVTKIDKESKSKILSKLKSIKLYWFESLNGTKYEKMPLEFLRWGLAYDPAPNEINIGVLALSYNSDEEIYASLLHEIAHSFDPCRWSAMIGGTNPFDKVISCLRSDSSVGAKVRDDSRILKLPENVRKVLVSNPTCNKSFYPFPGMQRDQILEVFADWFSAEVVGSGPEIFINKKLRRDLCRSNNLSSGSSYILNDSRLRRIYFANPKISNLVSAQSSSKYCKL